MKRFDSINVIPFIDIMLVLLAIVMTTASFIAQGIINVDLPEADTQQAAAPESSVELLISQDEAVYLDGKLQADDQLGMSLSELDPATPITLRVDRQVPFHRFITVVDLLKLNNLESTSIYVRQKT